MTASDFFASKLWAYFDGEKQGGMIAFILGLVALAISTYLFIYESTYKGILYPMALFGLIEAGVGAGLFLKTDKQASNLIQLHATSVPEFKKLEIPRMQKVMQNFKVIKVVWIILIITSVVTGFYFLSYNLIYSLCLGTIIQVSALLVFDLYAEKRADIYLQYILKL